MKPAPTKAQRKHAQKLTHRDETGRFKDPPHKAAAAADPPAAPPPRKRK